MSTKRGNSLVSHPFRAWYDEQILNGMPTTYIYNHQADEGKIPLELHVSNKTIGEYRNHILKPNKEIIKQFKEEKEKQIQEEIHQEIISEPIIHDSIEAKSTEMINAEKTFIDMHMYMKDQIIKLATIVDEKTMSKVAVAGTIGNLCDQLRLITMDFLKIQGELRDSPQTQINIVNIEKNNAEMDALKESIIGIMSEIDPSLIPRFFNLLRQKLNPIIQTFELKKQNVLTNDSSPQESQASKVVKQFIQRAEKIKKID